MIVSADEEIITAERVRLHPLLPTHADLMYPILADRRLYAFTGDEPPASITALRARYGQLQTRTSPDGTQQWLNWIVSLPRNPAVGYVQATVEGRHTDVAWLIGIDWQGMGIASEAASALVKWLLAQGIHTIRARINRRHTASQGVAKNAGLRRSNLVEGGENVWILRAAD